MRIAIVSYRFPPYNAMGAVSVGKTAKHLDRLGHDVRVVTAADQPLDPTLPLEIGADRVTATRWVNLSGVAEAALGGREKVAKTGFTAKGRVLKTLGRLYRDVVQVPDPQIGWYPHAVKVQWPDWKPDVVFASAGPYTSLLVGARLARKLGVPWVAGFRDLWTDNPYRDLPRPRAAFERWLERRVLRSAAGLVTVSDGLAETLRAKYDKPVAVVTNGFDDEDMVDAPRLDGPLVLTYTGTIVEGRRDPTPLFRAVHQLGLGPDDIRIRFVGRYLDAVDALRHREGVADVVELHDPVPYQEALRMQRESDVLLLLVWNDPREQGIVPGKVYEYLGSRRPVLLLGAADGVPAQLLAERDAGVTSTDPAVIAGAVEQWVKEKRAGGIPDVPASSLADLTRRAQTERLASFLAEAAGV